MVAQVPCALILVAAATVAQTDYDRGAALFQKGDYTAAIPFLLRAAESRPRDAQTWKALGTAYAAQAQYREAAPALHHACELDPKLPDACYYEARVLYALDRYEPSLEALERVARAEPESWKVRLGMAQALEALGRAAAAEKEFQQALTLARNADPQPGIAWGRFLVRQGRFDEAVAPLDDVVKHFPAAAEARVHLGRALLEEGKLADAIPHLERAVAIDPKSAQAHLLLANAYVRAGRAPEAQPHFEAAARYEEAAKAPRDL